MVDLPILKGQTWLASTAQKCTYITSFMMYSKPNPINPPFAYRYFNYHITSSYTIYSGIEYIDMLDQVVNVFDDVIIHMLY